MATKRKKARGFTRRKFATTRTLRRKVLSIDRTSGHRQPVFKINRVIQLLAITVLMLVSLTVVLVLPWRWWAPPTSAFMLYEQFGNDTKIHYRWVSWDRISSQLAIALVASEDQKFPTHYGFDFESIARAIDENKGRLRGASTITQQVAKNLFLWPGRSYLRKGIEAYFTVLVETLWSKRRILEVYMNVAEFGPGIFGAEAASRQFFKKPAQQLSLWEASLLAAVLPNPKKMSAGQPSSYVRDRARKIRAWVRKLGGRRYLNGIDGLPNARGLHPWFATVYCT